MAYAGIQIVFCPPRADRLRFVRGLSADAVRRRLHANLAFHPAGVAAKFNYDMAFRTYQEHNRAICGFRLVQYTGNLGRVSQKPFLKPNDPRRFQQNSLRGRTGNISHEREIFETVRKRSGQSRATTGLGAGCGSPMSQMRPTRRSFEASALREEAATPAPPRQACAPGTQCRPPTAIEPRLR